MSKKNKRYDPNRRIVKIKLLERYGCNCMICEYKFARDILQMHHLIKWEEIHYTSEKDCGIVCPECHDLINYAENHNTPLYKELNNKIRRYKQMH